MTNGRQSLTRRLSQLVSRAQDSMEAATSNLRRSSSRLNQSGRTDLQNILPTEEQIKQVLSSGAGAGANLEIIDPNVSAVISNSLQEDIKDEELDTNFSLLIDQIKTKFEKYSHDGRLEKMVGHAQIAQEFLTDLKKEIYELSIHAHPENANPTQWRADGSINNSIDILVETATRAKAVLDQLAATSFGPNPLTIKKRVMPILQKFNVFLDMIPLIFEAYTMSGIEAHLPEQVYSVEMLQTVLSKRMTMVMQKLIDKYTSHRGDLGLLEAFKFSNDEGVLNKFDALPPILKYSFLIAIQELNNELTDFVLLLDELELRFEFKEGTLLDLIKIKPSFEQQSILSQLSFNNKTLKEVCVNVGEVYVKRMSLSGFAKYKDVYPYEKSKYHHRKALKASTLDSREKNLVTYQKRILLTALQESVKRINFLQKKNNDTNLLQDVKSVLEEFISEENGRTLSAVFKALNTISQASRENPYFSEITNYFLKAIDYYKTKEKHLDGLCERIAEKVRMQDQQDSLCPESDRLINTAPDLGENHYELLAYNFDQLMTQVRALVQNFTIEESMTDNETAIKKEEKLPQLSADSDDEHSVKSAGEGVEENSLDVEKAVIKRNLLNEAVLEVDNKLKALLDQDIYDQFFVEMPVPAPLESSNQMTWIQTLGQTFLSSKRMIASLNMLMTDFVSNNPRPDLVQAATPHDALARLLDSVTQSMKIVNELSGLIKQLAADPFIGHCFTGLRNLLSVGAAPSVKAHPWHQFLQKEGLGVAKTITNARYKYNVTLKLIEDNIDQLIKPFETLDLNWVSNQETNQHMHEAVRNTIRQMGVIMEDLSPLMEAAAPSYFMEINKPTIHDTVALSYKHVGAIYHVMRNLSLAYHALEKVGQDKLYLLVNELLEMCKHFYLFLTKAEMMFYLKRGALTQLPLNAVGIQWLDDKVNGKVKHLADVIQDFERLLMSLDYPLSQEQRYPYALPALKQAQAMLAAVPADDLVKKQFMSKRIQEFDHDFLADKQRHYQEYRQKISKKDVIDRINHRIAELKNEIKKSWYFTHATELKVQLLTNLKRELRTKSMPDSLAAIHHHAFLGKHSYLLHQGDTAKMMHEIELGLMTKPELQTCIDNEINRLVKARAAVTWLAWLFDWNREARFRARIEALRSLILTMSNDVALPKNQLEVIQKYDASLLSDVYYWQECQKRYAEKELNYSFSAAQQFWLVSEKMQKDLPLPSEQIGLR